MAAGCICQNTAKNFLCLTKIRTLCGIFQLVTE